MSALLQLADTNSLPGKAGALVSWIVNGGPFVGFGAAVAVAAIVGGGVFLISRKAINYGGCFEDQFTLRIFFRSPGEASDFAQEASRASKRASESSAVCCVFFAVFSLCPHFPPSSLVEMALQRRRAFRSTLVTNVGQGTSSLLFVARDYGSWCVFQTQ